MNIVEHNLYERITRPRIGKMFLSCSRFMGEASAMSRVFSTARICCIRFCTPPPENTKQNKS